MAAIEIISRAFYALEDTLTPVLVGMLQLIAMWLIGAWLAKDIFPSLEWLSFGGLALGYTISTMFELVLLLWLLRRKMGGIDGRRILNGVWRMIVASLFMAVISWLTLQQLTEIPVFWQLLVVGLVASLSYLLASLALGVTELRAAHRYSPPTSWPLKTKNPAFAGLHNIQTIMKRV